MAELKVPPHSAVAEQSILGAVLLDRDAVVAVVEFLQPGHFYDEKHQKIFECVVELYQEREPVDVVTVMERLKKKKALTDVGGSGYLTELVSQVPTAAHAEHYGHLVKDMFTKRELISAAAQITNMAFDEAGDVRQILDNAESSVFSLAQQHLRQVFVPVKNILAESFDRLDELHKTAGSMRGVPTGFSDLDDALAGMQDSNLLILAARPGVGKCVTGDTLIMNPESGKMGTIATLVRNRKGKLLTMNQTLKMQITEPAEFVADGVKPVLELSLALGNRLKATAVHPVLTIGGWKRMEELQVGDRIAVPRELPYFGKEVWEENRIKCLAYLLGDGNLTNTCPRFTNQDPRLRSDFTQSAKQFGNIKVSWEKSGAGKTPTLVVSSFDRYAKGLRKAFAGKLKAWIAGAGWTQAQVARMAAVSPAAVSLWTNGVGLPGGPAGSRLGRFWDEEMPVLRRNPMTDWLRELGVMGTLSIHKEIPGAVFGLTRENLALFLNRLYACEGSIVLGKNHSVRLSFASSSERMAGQVRHLLLRFGILSRLRKKQVKYRGERKVAFEVEILGAGDILNFVRNIGVFGKEKEMEAAVKLAKAKLTAKNWTKDTLPMEVWKTVLAEKGSLSWRKVYQKMGRPVTHNIHCYRRELRRETLGELAVALNSRRLAILAESEVYWDRVVKIVPAGEEEVYDLTVEGSHNFVANDIVVHNTALALNIAQNAAFRFKQPVGFFSLEMSKEELMDRLLVSQAEIDAWKMKTGRLDEDEFTRLSDAMGELYETPLFIDDTPGMSILEMRTKARRLQAEHGLRLIIVDYLQLARASRVMDNRVQEVSEISQGLKNLARELKIPVLAISQLSRQVESRGVKRPQLADLRESGAIEQDADVVMFLWRENDEDLENMNLEIAKHRNGPLRSIRLRFRGERIKFYSVEGRRKG